MLWKSDFHGENLHHISQSGQIMPQLEPRANWHRARASSVSGTQCTAVQCRVHVQLHSTVQCTLNLDFNNTILFYLVFDVILVVLDNSKNDNKFKIKTRPMVPQCTLRRLGYAGGHQVKTIFTWPLVSYHALWVVIRPSDWSSYTLIGHVAFWLTIRGLGT